MTDQTTLILKNAVSELDRVMKAVSDICARHSISPDMEYDLTLAVHEMVSNVARHAYPDGGVHFFSLQIVVSDREFVVCIEDDGIDFDPTSHPPPNLDVPAEEREEGGLGIHLVRQIMTSMEHQRISGKNVLTMRKMLT